MNSSFLGIHTPTSGKRTLRFKKPTDLFDVYNEKNVCKQVTEFILDLPARHSALYFMGTKQEWENLRK